MLLLIDMFQVEITVAKYPNRVLVYGIENDVPIFFDVDGRGSQIYPSGWKNMMDLKFHLLFTGV